MTEKQTAAAADVDTLLQDTYLLVVELRQGASLQNSDEVVKLCANQIDRVQLQLKHIGLCQRSIDHISHAQCALLDETLASCAEGDAHADWASEPLQARFFGRHQAGESLYEDMREVLREPAPDLYVLTVFQRVLTLGFQGRYRDSDDPARAQLVAALTGQVAPLELSQALPTHVSTNYRIVSLSWLRSPLAHVAAAGVLLLGTWWGLDRVLGDVIVTLLLGKA